MNYRLLENRIDSLWKRGVLNDNSHIFFKDINNVLNIVKDMRKGVAEDYKIKDFTNDIVICKNRDTYPKIHDLKFRSTEYDLPLTEKDIEDFSNFLYTKKRPTNNDIINYIEKIRNKPLPSTIKLDKYLEKIRDSKNKKILIIGGGPNGLFIASYLNYIYNQSYNGIIKDDKIDILLIDNMIVKEGFRKPYTRNRRFAFDEFSLSIIYRFLYCNADDFPMEPIKYIEYLAYIKLYMNKIPMYFTKKYEDWTDICELINEYKFDVVFDSTGGRLNVPQFKIPKNYLSSIKNITENNREIAINGDNIILKSNLPNDPVMNMFSLEFYDKNRELLNDYDDIRTMHTCDIDIYHHYSGKLLNRGDLLKISDLIIDKIDKRTFKNVLKNDNIKYYKINYIQLKMHHKIKIAKEFKYKNKKFLYIGSGDTIFHSHFITGAGINRLFNFIVRVLYLF